MHRPAPIASARPGAPDGPGETGVGRREDGGRPPNDLQVKHLLRLWDEQCTPPHPVARPRLPLAGVLRLGRPSDIWFKPALSVVVAVAPPNLTLLALGRLDLAMYTMAGSLCALYAHNRPYAARARVLAWVVLGMLGGLGVALVTASLTTNTAVLVTVGALLAATQKTLCDATRVGPPGHVVLAFISSASLFVPQHLGQVPGTSRWARPRESGPGSSAWPPDSSARTVPNGVPRRTR